MNAATHPATIALPTPADDQPENLLTLSETGPELARLTAENADLVSLCEALKDCLNEREALAQSDQHATLAYLDRIRDQAEQRRTAEIELDRCRRTLEAERKAHADRLQEVFQLVWDEALAFEALPDVRFKIEAVQCEEGGDHCDGFRRDGLPTCARCAS